MTFVLATTTGGTGTHVRSLAACLVARGCDVAVLGPAATGRRAGFTSTGARFMPVEIADRPRPLPDLISLVRLRRLLHGRAFGSPAVVHAHGLRAGAFTALALRAFHRRRRPAFIVTLHNAPPAAGGTAGRIYRVLERIVARQADRVLCVSDDLGARMRGLGARRVGRAVVAAPATSGVSAAAAHAVREELGAAGRPLLLAVGRLAPQKGFATLVAATAELGAHDPGPLVVIAGEGPERARLARDIYTQRLPLKILGHRSDVPALLAAADVLVLPSLWEGQPLILQEAMRAGMPIVAARTGGIGDLAGDDAALLVPPGDPQRLAAALARVLYEPGLAARLSAAAVRRARSLPDEAAAAGAVLAEYRAVLRPRRLSPR